MTLAEVPAPRAGGPECAALLAALPETLGDARRTVFGDPVGAAAWTSGGVAPPVTLRCGLDRPRDFVQGVVLSQINGVQWFRVAADPLVTYYSVDRPVYVAVTVGGDAGTGPIQELSDVVAATLPSVAVDPAPIG